MDKGASELSIILLNPGDLVSSRQMGDRITAVGLGAGVGVVAQTGAADLICAASVALPDSAANHRLGRTRPGYFADTAIAAIAALLNGFPEGTTEGITFKLIGGATLMTSHRTFDIGRRNLDAIHGALDKLGLAVAVADVGGNVNRSFSVEVGSGISHISAAGKGEWQI